MSNNMDRAIRFGVAIILCVPLLLKIPYLINSWRYSPLDKSNWWFWAAAALTAVGLELQRLLDRHHQPGPLPRGGWKLSLTVLCGALLCWIACLRLDINVVKVVAALGMLGAGIWLTCGWRRLEAFMPAFALLMMGLPSSNYWLEFYLGSVLGMEALVMKLLAVLILLLGWIISKSVYEYEFSPAGVLFCLAALIVAIFILADFRRLEPGNGFRLKLSARSGKWVGNELSLEPIDRKFFMGCEVAKWIYYDNHSQVGVLEVATASDTHQIHPVGICLRSSGWTINSQRQRHISLEGTALQAEVISAAKDGGDYLIYSWYSDGRVSTGDFKVFRRLWHPGGNWMIYQLSTPEGSGQEAAALRLDDFMESFHYRHK